MHRVSPANPSLRAMRRPNRVFRATPIPFLSNEPLDAAITMTPTAATDTAMITMKWRMDHAGAIGRAHRAESVNALERADTVKKMMTMTTVTMITIIGGAILAEPGRAMRIIRLFRVHLI